MGQDRADAERFHCLSRNTTMVGGAETLAYGRVWPRRGRDYREGQQAQSVRNLQSTRDCRPENTRMNDLAEITEFAKRYAKAWCSQNPESVATFFAERGSLSINNGPPAIGRAAIAKEAQAFMTTFPDMIVTMDKVVHDEEGTKFHWTLTGTNTGPRGTGKRVRINGYELWKFDPDGLIAESKGQFDSAEYQRQLKHGVDG